MSGENIEPVRVNRGFVQPTCKIIYISPIRNGGWYGVLKMQREQAQGVPLRGTALHKQSSKNENK